MANPFINSAKKLIYRHGITVVFTKVIEGNYDSNTGSVVNTEITTPVVAYPEDVIVNQYNFPNLINREVTKYLVVSSDLGYKPEPNDKITNGTSVSTILTVKDIVARNESVIYIVHAVKS